MYKKKYIVQFFGTMCKTRKVKKSKLKEFRITFFYVTQKRFLAQESHKLSFSQFANDFLNLTFCPKARKRQNVHLQKSFKVACL